MPGPAMCPIINSKNEAIRRDTYRSRGVSIASRYQEKHLGLCGPGPAMVKRDLLDNGASDLWIHSQ